MDDDNELARAKWLMIAGVFFLLSCFMCWDELAYLISGKEAQATITKAYESNSRGRRSLTVEYSWNEPEGTMRKDMRSVSTDWVPPADGKLAIIYTPGAEGRSRFLGHPAWLWIILFFTSVSSVGFFIYRLVREANEDLGPRRKGR